jgi:hypothetical protein
MRRSIRNCKHERQIFPTFKNKSSLLSRIRATLLALGKSERAAGRSARLLSSASFADFVRLTPAQNAKLGLTPKARHYALKGARIYKATPTISARQFEIKRASELFGVTPEKATHARRHGAISYVSPDQRDESRRPRLPARRTTSSQPSKSCGRPARPFRAIRQTSGGTERLIRSLNTPRAATAPSGVASSRANIFLTANGSGSSTTLVA